MDLNSPKVTNADKLDMCKKYFYMGFAFLPFLWLINAVWFFGEAFWKPPYPEQKTIKKLVIASGFGSLVWFIVFISWVIVFTENRAAWGATGDRMSSNIPIGMP